MQINVVALFLCFIDFLLKRFWKMTPVLDPYPYVHLWFRKIILWKDLSGSFFFVEQSDETFVFYFVTIQFH